MNTLKIFLSLMIATFAVGCSGGEKEIEAGQKNGKGRTGMSCA